MFNSVRSRLIASFVVIVLITLVTAGVALFARLGGYRDQLTASTLRQVAAPVYYNLTLFPQAGVNEAASGRRLRTDLTDYLRQQAQDTGVIVLLLDAQGRVIRDQAAGSSLSNERFDVPPPPQRGPDFAQLPEHRHTLQSGVTLTYVTVPMPRAVRLQPAGVAAIVVALPDTSARDVFRDLTPRLIFAGLVGLAAALLVGGVVWAWIYRPLGRVTHGIRAVARGDYRQRVPVSGPTEVRALADDVNAMADSVQTSQRTLRDFLANVSHELRTPLTSIRGFSQAMLDGTLDTPEERARAARVIDFESRRLLHLVGELLDLSRIQSGQQAMALADVAVPELLTHVGDVFSVRAAEQGVALHVAADADEVVVADFDRLEQVLGNLLDNALRHTPAGGSVTVGARAAQGGSLEFFVGDDGAGITPADLPHVFDRFYRSGDEATGTGSGLGLTISREIVRAHGGEIRVESQPDRGTTFTFSLPMSGERAAPSTSGGGRRLTRVLQ
ncbi:MAG TPA: HAMP domain-containing sensor histidine kinase [Dehalococcoidia bacterium]|nr:HAMP domain-containing sensor histidine kinase [Dehalococcoidia bacterium]